MKVFIGSNQWWTQSIDSSKNLRFATHEEAINHIMTYKYKQIPESSQFYGFPSQRPRNNINLEDFISIDNASSFVHYNSEPIYKNQ